MNILLGRRTMYLVLVWSKLWKILFNIVQNTFNYNINYYINSGIYII